MAKGCVVAPNGDQPITGAMTGATAAISGRHHAATGRPSSRSDAL